MPQLSSLAPLSGGLAPHRHLYKHTRQRCSLASDGYQHKQHIRKMLFHHCMVVALLQKKQNPASFNPL